MAKVIALCGKICSGKSTYAEKIRGDNNAVVLNPDTILLTLFDENLGDRHEDIFEKVRIYLYQMAENIINTGTNVILDFGLWTYKERRDIRLFFTKRDINIEIHYVNTPLKIIESNIKKRNRIRNGVNYYIDDSILNKGLSLFEEPDNSETDLVIEDFVL